MKPETAGAATTPPARNSAQATTEREKGATFPKENAALLQAGAGLSDAEAQRKVERIMQPAPREVGRERENERGMEREM